MRELQTKAQQEESKSARSVERLVSYFLRVGVLTSAAVILSGLIYFLMTGDSGYPNDVYPTDLTAIGKGVLELKPFAVLLMGLFMLILTPVLRVGVSLLVFIKEKDRLYVIITLIVLISAIYIVYYPYSGLHSSYTIVYTQTKGVGAYEYQRFCSEKNWYAHT